MYTDAEYQRTVVPDGDVFSKTKESRVMIGYDKEFVAGWKGAVISVEPLNISLENPKNVSDYLCLTRRQFLCSCPVSFFCSMFGY
jgi:hypothetical protein